MTRSAPLAGLRVIELAGKGPCPHAAMMFADLGADVIRVVRPGATPDVDFDLPELTLRGKRTIEIDLKDPSGAETFRKLVTAADVLVEGYRPGVAERLGIGPGVCRELNARLVYGRVTGWGQDGPLAQQAGHDINYIALTGALHATGTADRPIPPLNLVGDFGGGSMLLVVGVLAALLERDRSGHGQVVDAAMLDGASLLMQGVWWLYSGGTWQDERASNSLDGGAPYYRTYRCADGRYAAVGCIEPQFYAQLLAGLGLDPAGLPGQRDRARWPELAAAIGAAFASKPRDHWTDVVFAGTDACVSAVLSLAEVPEHPQIRARQAVLRTADGIQATPAPRFSDTPVDKLSDIADRVTNVADLVAEWLGAP